MPTVYTANSKSAAITKAILGACKPCCGSGSGSGSGATRPCGCFGCKCCADICWWKTDWPHHWTTTSGKYASGNVGPTWLMTTYNMTLHGPFDDYYWGGDVGIGAGCQLGMAGKLNSNCILEANSVLIMSGQVAWSNGVDTQTFDIRFKMDLQIQFDCPNPDGYVFAIYFGTECDDPGFFTFLNSIQLTADYLVAQDSGTDEIGVDTSTCSFTITSPTNIGLPSMTIVGVV